MKALITISILVMLLVGCGEQPERRSVIRKGSESRILQVGLVLESPTADAIQMEAPQKNPTGRNTNEVLNIRIVPDIDDTNLEATQIQQRGDAFGIDVQFKGKTRQRLAEFTRKNIGKDIAIIIDGNVLGTMKIRNEVSDGWLLIRGNWTLKEAMAFCDRLDPPAGAKQKP